MFLIKSSSTVSVFCLAIIICWLATVSVHVRPAEKVGPERTHEFPQQTKRRSNKHELYSRCRTKVWSGEVLVKFNRPLTSSTLQILSEPLLEKGKKRSFSFEELGTGEKLWLVHFDGLKVDAVLAFFNSLKLRSSEVMAEQKIEVEYVEPNFVFTRDEVPSIPQQANIPDDFNANEQWGLLDSNTGNAGISAVSAWKTSKGSRDIVVGVVDTGVLYSHPDLARNMWCAPRDFTVRVGAQDITCLEDTHGFSAGSMTCNPIDSGSHGTRVSGIVGAEGDNTLGIVGVNWRSSILGLQWDDGNGDYPDIVNAISFALEVKKAGDLANLRILNNSYGYYAVRGDPECRPQSLITLIQEANDYGILFVASAGNKGWNTDLISHYPSGLGLPNIISVAGTTKKDELYLASNYGKTSVHLGAPGAKIKSTAAGDDYSSEGGTSFAAPFVSGAAALILSKPGSQCAKLTPVQLKECILESADQVPSLQSKLPQGRRLNLNRAINDCEKYLH